MKQSVKVTTKMSRYKPKGGRVVGKNGNVKAIKTAKR